MTVPYRFLPHRNLPSDAQEKKINASTKRKLKDILRVEIVNVAFAIFPFLNNRRMSSLKTYLRLIMPKINVRILWRLESFWNQNCSLLISETKLITINSPIREQFEILPTDETCFCSHISLQTRFHQVCSSDFVSNRWVNAISSYLLDDMIHLFVVLETTYSLYTTSNHYT